MLVEGSDLFSKFEFKGGRYDNITLNQTDTSKTKYYALDMALEAKRFSNTELCNLLGNQIGKKV
jgi:hypothetical protein